jgi:hypothetical protein
LIPLHAGGMPHIIGKLLTKETLLQTSPQSEVCTQNYGTLKSRVSQFWEFRDSHLGVPVQNDYLDAGLVAKHRVYYKGESGGFPQV